jgi:hypothetical protein
MFEVSGNLESMPNTAVLLLPKDRDGPTWFGFVCDWAGGTMNRVEILSSVKSINFGFMLRS